jgi:hypothetical protein
VGAADGPLRAALARPAARLAGADAAALAGAAAGAGGHLADAAHRAFALLAVAVAFVSASQDVVIDAYRTDLLPPAERGLGASLNVPATGWR